MMKATFHSEEEAIRVQSNYNYISDEMDFQILGDGDITVREAQLDSLIRQLQRAKLWLNGYEG